MVISQSSFNPRMARAPFSRKRRHIRMIFGSRDQHYKITKSVLENLLSSHPSITSGPRSINLTMPLLTTDLKPAALAETLQSDAKTDKPSFLVVYASLTDGRSWCGDCRAAESFVNAKFANSDEVVRVVYAGQRDE
jgi:hypothetical protein